MSEIIMEEPAFRVLLPQAHWRYLTESLCLPSPLADRLRASASSTDPRGRVQLLLAFEDADEIRQLCAERLQIVGFDEDYKHTDEGQVLEDLIDYFFTG